MTASTIIILTCPRAIRFHNTMNRFARNGYVMIQNDTQMTATTKEKKETAEAAATKEKKIRIERIHLEEDAGRLNHDQMSGKEKESKAAKAAKAAKESMVDLNRAGVPLIEIVTQPDLETPEQAVAFLKKVAGSIAGSWHNRWKYG